MADTSFEIAKAIADGIAIIVAGFAIYKTSQDATEARKVQRNLQEKQQEFTQALQEKQQEFTQALQRSEQLLTQRQFAVQVFDRAVVLSDIDPDPNKTIGPDVKNAVNFLSLVAMCWQAGQVDKELLYKMFGAVFLKFHAQVNSCRKVPGYKETGPELLAQDARIGDVHKIFTEMKADAERIK